MSKTQRLSIILVAVGVVSVSILGCFATTADVKRAVANTNAAAVSPYLQRWGETGTGDWRSAIREIDGIIAANADQTVLVNQLRVRQAMLLTVNRQDALATLRWEAIDGSQLNTERDRTLYANREGLVWWYKRADNLAPLNLTERTRATEAVQTLGQSINAVDDREIRLLLETLRAQMIIGIANPINTVNSDGSANALQDSVRGMVKAATTRFVRAFPQSHRDWIMKDGEVIDNANTEGMVIADLRHRVWLLALIKEFRELDRTKSLSVVWEPVWVGTVDLN